jgi:hypothetical protein
MNLNGAHIHLLVNHIPVFTTIFGVLLVVWGVLRKSEEVLRLGLVVVVIASIATWLVTLTGDPAEHVIIGIQGVDRRMIHAHEDAGDLANMVTGAAGVVALITMVLMQRRHRATRAFALVTALVGLIGFGLVARAANLGGEIRHPEIRAGFVPPPPPPRPAGAPREGGDGD